MSDIINILFVDNSVTDYDLAINEIRKAGLVIVGKCVANEKDFISAIGQFKPDIILSEHVMPGYNGMEALAVKLKMCPDVPFIMLTASTNEEAAAECMRIGADDYVIKEHIKRLPHAVKGALIRAKAKGEARIASQEVARMELLLRTAVNNLPSTFTIYDAHGRIEYINEYGLMLADCTLDQTVGRREEDVFPEEITQHYLHALKKAFESKELQIIECIIPYKDLPRYVAYFFVPAFDENSNLYKVIGITYDITERKIAEEKLLVAMKKAEEYGQIKSAFLSNISHEIRTPLNAIMGFAQMITKNYSHDEQLMTFMDIIMISSNQLLDIIREMLEISQLMSGKSSISLTEFSVTGLMQELYAYYQKQEEQKIKQYITFELDISKVPVNNDLIKTDREKLVHILKNLFNNAFKFTYGGRIVAGCMGEPPDSWHFYVKDTGIGIEKGKLEFIFDTFRQGDESNTRQFGGVGLGLAVCREMVNLLGGRIWVESEVKKGSVFHFVLPVKRTLL
ncbi:MAG: response regulator [Bacteroidales bacterium]|nr:response regulator [Bacteroidales bacterium]